MKSTYSLVSAMIALFLLASCAVFPRADACDVRFDAVLESTGDYRAAFDAYYACRDGEINGLD
jgi:hypothetical protein